jgi:hypothetical protein
MAEERAQGKLAKELAKLGTKRGTTRVAEKPASPTLVDCGIDKNLADIARKAARIREDKFRAVVDKAVLIAVASVEGTTAVIRAARVERHQQKRQPRKEREEKIAPRSLCCRRNATG